MLKIMKQAQNITSETFILLSCVFFLSLHIYEAGSKFIRVHFSCFLAVFSRFCFIIFNMIQKGKGNNFKFWGQYSYIKHRIIF